MTSDEIAFIKRLNASLPKEKRRPLPHHKLGRGRYQNNPTIEELRALNHDDYATTVTSQVGVEHEDLWNLLLSPPLLRRTQAALLRKRAAVLRILQEPRAGHRGKERNERIRAYLNLIEDRLQQTETHIGDDTIETQRRTIRRLATAIRDHQKATAANRVEPEAWDENLWRVLDQIDTSSTQPDDRDTRTA